MSRSSTQRASVPLLVVGALLLASLAGASAANASTLYACVTKAGAAHIFTKNPKCKKKEKKVSWNTEGKAGANGTNGANGANGTNGKEGVPGQPQHAVRFNASQAASLEPTPISLFSADGISYTFVCQSVIFFEFGGIYANGPSGQTYGLGNFGRPAGKEVKTNDLKSEVNVTTLGGGAKLIASTVNAAENAEKSFEQWGVWETSIEGPTTTTLIHAWFDTGSGGPCTVRGTAITIPN